jgi:UDP-N-acetylglucosamine 2-epimerase (non-hydrolysing)
MAYKVAGNIKKHLAIVLGARPNFIKAAPFLIRAKKYPDFKFTLIHTGQHFDKNMSEIFFEQMRIPRPDIHFDIKSGLFTEKIGIMTNKLNAIFLKNNFDGVIVFGDVISTLAGAVSAVKNGRPLIHIEAGLRSHDRRMPEEITRTMVDHVSDLLFVTEPSARANLLKEGVEKEKIKYVGNLMIESIELFKDKINASLILDKISLKKRKYVVATIHRQENTDSTADLKKIFMLLNGVNKSLLVVMPLHPGTRNKVQEFKLGKLLKNFKIIEPLGYFDFMKLVTESGGVITDSGGIQEETSHLGIPCCTLRESTERPITIELGSNKLFSLESVDIKELLAHLNRKNFNKNHIPLWDKEVSKRIFDQLS